MDHREQEASGSLYSFSPGQRPRRLLKELRISNGLAWAPDGKTMYFIDTPTRDVTAFDYDLKTGQIANPRRIIHFDKSFGWPDGMTTDTDGNLWIAMWGGARVSQWRPDGMLLAQFGVAAKNVTSCVFGGVNMNELFITTAMLGMDADRNAQVPPGRGHFPHGDQRDGNADLRIRRVTVADSRTGDRRRRRSQSRGAPGHGMQATKTTLNPLSDVVRRTIVHAGGLLE